MCFIQGSITDNGVEISTGMRRHSIDPNGNSSGLETVKEKQKFLFVYLKHWFSLFLKVMIKNKKLPEFLPFQMSLETVEADGYWYCRTKKRAFSWSKS